MKELTGTANQAQEVRNVRSATKRSTCQEEKGGKRKQTAVSKVDMIQQAERCLPGQLPIHPEA